VAMVLKMPGFLSRPSWLPARPSLPVPGWSWLRPKYPPVAFELDPKCLSMARIGRRKDETYLASFNVQELPAEMVELDFMKARLSAPERFREMVAQAMERDPGKLKGVSVIIPDSFARVAILSFDEMPRRRADAIELVRFKTRKAVPFKVEDAAVDFQVLPGDAAGVNVLAVLTPKAVVQEFESAFAAVGLQPGLVDLSTFSLINLYAPILEKEMGATSEYLLANVTSTYFTFVIFRGPSLIFFRCKTFAAGFGDDGGEGAMRLLKRELQTSLVYYREKLGGSDLARAYLRVVDLDPEAVERVFASVPEVLSTVSIDPRRAVAADGRVSGAQGDRLLQRLAPAIGAATGRGGP